MSTFLSRLHFEEASNFVKAQTQHSPTLGLVLGSGLGELADDIQQADRIQTNEIPHWPTSTVKGHSGELVIGKLEGHTVLVLRGRTHYYEGYSMSQVTLYVRVMQLMGIETLILTNAAGGLRRDMEAGDLMLIADHINLLGMAGANPLRGPNDDSLGPRFPDMGQVYDAELRTIAREVAREAKIPMKEGIYIAQAGPSFETPADYRFLRLIGADAVGMSTVPEATVARHGGIRVLGISGISNIARTEVDPSAKITSPTTEAVASPHEEVLETGRILVPRLLTILRGVLQKLPPSAS